MAEPPSSRGGFHARQHDSLVISEMSNAAGGPGLSKEEKVIAMTQFEEQPTSYELDKQNLTALVPRTLTSIVAVARPQALTASMM